MKKTTLVVALVVIALIASIIPAQAQAGVTWTSGVQVRNLENTTSTVSLRLFKQDGSLAGNPTATIGPEASLNFYPLPVAAGFNGSLIIDSTTNVRVVHNMQDVNNTRFLASSTGFQSGTTTVNLPLIMCNNSGFNSYFNVQNVGTADANFTVDYIPGSNGTARTEQTNGVKPGAARTYDQTVGSSTVNCSTLKDGSGKFIGSARVTSTQPIVASVSELNATNFPVLLAYGGFGVGSSKVELPLIQANNANFYTSIQVQNTGNAATQVTVKYSANTVAGGKQPQDEVFNLAAGASKTIINNAGPGGASGSVNNWNNIGRFIGGATVTSTGQTLVAVVNQQRLTSGALASAYEGFNPNVATTRVSTPLIQANNATYYSSIQVQNVGDAATTVTIDYGPNTAGTFNPVNEVFTLQPGQMRNVIQDGAPPTNNGANNWGTNRYVGSAMISSSGQKIVANVNQMSFLRSGDQLSTYNGFNY